MPCSFEVVLTVVSFLITKSSLADCGPCIQDACVDSFNNKPNWSLQKRVIYLIQCSNQKPNYPRHCQRKLSPIKSHLWPISSHLNRYPIPLMKVYNKTIKLKTQKSNHQNKPLKLAPTEIIKEFLFQMDRPRGSQITFLSPLFIRDRNRVEIEHTNQVKMWVSSFLWPDFGMISQTLQECIKRKSQQETYNK